ncbi:MAG: hypothetical protein H6606_08390 [Flavobacteriales bacterium]|nr:hypothetical protein [Flavobacteriales bacterium]
MAIWKKIWSYLRLKKDTENAGNANIRLMHGINKISIFLFLIGLIVLVTKCVS